MSMTARAWPQNSLLDSIEFRGARRESSVEFADFGSHGMDGGIGEFLDEEITIIHDDKTRACLEKLRGIPRMSTMAIGLLLHMLVEILPGDPAYRLVPREPFF